ncbi:unnamed protein product [Staurois parvus]|uniref:Uncharacterized protein n=1 Tax=Staurois parvus TaxID=386267 RepID=A0ABN9HBN5_9NEOB|nr:unnamed protein product [Staurois parvus]
MNVIFKILKFPTSFVPRTSRHRRERNPEDRCRHRPEDMAGDATGGTLWECRTR